MIFVALALFLLGGLVLLAVIKGGSARPNPDFTERE